MRPLPPSIRQNNHSFWRLKKYSVNEKYLFEKPEKKEGLNTFNVFILKVKQNQQRAKKKKKPSSPAPPHHLVRKF